MRNLRLAVQRQLGIKPRETVVLGRERHIVIGREILQMDPALPRGHQRALGAARFELIQNRINVLPCRQIRIRVHASGLHRIAVHPQHRR